MRTASSQTNTATRFPAPIHHGCHWHTRTATHACTFVFSSSVCGSHAGSVDLIVSETSPLADQTLVSPIRRPFGFGPQLSGRRLPAADSAGDGWLRCAQLPSPPHTFIATSRSTVRQKTEEERHTQAERSGASRRNGRSRSHHPLRTHSDRTHPAGGSMSGARFDRPMGTTRSVCQRRLSSRIDARHLERRRRGRHRVSWPIRDDHTSDSCAGRRQFEWRAQPNRESRVALAPGGTSGAQAVRRFIECGARWRYSSDSAVQSARHTSVVLEAIDATSIRTKQAEPCSLAATAPALPISRPLISLRRPSSRARTHATRRLKRLTSTVLAPHLGSIDSTLRLGGRSLSCAHCRLSLFLSCNWWLSSNQLNHPHTTNSP